MVLLPQLAPVFALLLGFVGDAELIEAILEPRDQQAGGWLPIGHRFLAGRGRSNLPVSRLYKRHEWRDHGFVVREAT